MHALATFWVNLPLRHKGLIVLALPLAALLLGSAASIAQRQEQEHASNETRRTLEIQAELQEVLTGLVDAEASVRGYLLAGDPAFLEPYERSVTAVPASLNRLDTLVRDPQVRLGLETELGPFVTQRLERLADLKALGDQAVEFPVAVPQDQLVASKSAVDRTRTTLAAMGRAGMFPSFLMTEECSGYPVGHAHALDSSIDRT